MGLLAQAGVRGRCHGLPEVSGADEVVEDRKGARRDRAGPGCGRTRAAKDRASPAAACVARPANVPIRRLDDATVTGRGDDAVPRSGLSFAIGSPAGHRARPKVREARPKAREARRWCPRRRARATSQADNGRYGKGGVGAL